MWAWNRAPTPPSARLSQAPRRPNRPTRAATPSGADRPAEPEPPPQYSPVKEHKPLWKRFGGLIVAAVVLIVKFGAKLKGLLLLLPKVKVLSTSATALVSVAAYALIWT